MIKFSPTSLNFGYDFVLLVQFFGTPCIMIVFYCIYLYIYKVKQITKALQFWALNVFCARTADIVLTKHSPTEFRQNTLILLFQLGPNLLWGQVSVNLEFSKAD